jgi:EAL domain-containing protein (putative c-di-GMP-specific phosphodiesterase class I)
MAIATSTIPPGAAADDAPRETERILIVEDDDGVARALQRLLAAPGIQVMVASDGAAATELLVSTRFDLVISDIHLPGATGVDILRTVRAYHLDVPVILMTGNPTVDTAIEAVNLGALKYLPKPFKPDELRAEVRRALGLSRLARLKREALRLSGEGADGPGDLAGLMSRFERALDGMWMAFQPIVELKTKKTFGYEALLRSREPSLPSPLDVIDAAERLHQTRRLGGRVRELVGAAMNGGMEDSARVFLNLHPSELLDPSLYDERSPMMPFASRVVLEVTERSAIESVHDVRARTSVLRFHGYSLAVDDLGAGYAGLTSFVTLEPEIVKIDMSLVRGIDASRTRREIVASIVRLCEELDIRVVAEGIETPEELRIVHALGCQYAQGYHLGRPADLFNAS